MTDRREPQFTLQTKWYADGRIVQNLDLRGELMTRVMDTSEEAIRNALIELGWTPPKS